MNKKLTSFEIEKNVPIVSRKTYPFSDMEIGDSFSVPHRSGVFLLSA